MAIRLLRTDDVRLCFFLGDAIPEYAILSHTWGGEELSFQEMAAIEGNQEHPATKKAGYQKVVDTCRKAREDEIAYVWIDTCCIDKTSSSELTEAINSMYRWYERAKICYVLLADLDISDSDFEADFPKCKWFTRGWCLQELLAPWNLHFFDRHWSFIGSKAALKSFISKITLIPEVVLVDGRHIKYLPVAQKMSWAANRETTRMEDMAYSLLGIFDVNMPMLYGEGSRAFSRLQEEIIFRSNDRSIFAFLCEPSSQVVASAFKMPINSSLFATSPGDFSDCSHLENWGPLVSQSEAFALTNKGLYFRRARLLVEPRRGLFSLPLNHTLSLTKEARMLLRKVGPGLFSKVGNTTSAKNEELVGDLEDSYPILEEEIYISNAAPTVRYQLYSADEYSIHVRSHKHIIFRAVQAIQRAPSSDRWDASRMLFLTYGERPVRAHWKVFPHLARKVDKPDTGIMNTQQTPFYLVAGVDHAEDGRHPQAWVRIYSLKEWRSLEDTYGIITNLDDVAGHQDNASTSCRMESPCMAITASVQLERKEQSPCFELTLDFDTDFRG